MESFKGQGNVQMLLIAEQEAQHLISAARKSKISRLKAAKEEAEREMVHYRSDLEAEHKKKISETNSEAIAKRLEEETEKKIENLKESASKVSSDVVGMPIKCVTTIKN
ncbi:hypothetical protein UlMin_035570 [Ulmus minor]